jgi:hypothetical protein
MGHAVLCRSKFIDFCELSYAVPIGTAYDPVTCRAGCFR